MTENLLAVTNSQEAWLRLIQRINEMPLPKKKSVHSANETKHIIRSFIKSATDDKEHSLLATAFLDEIILKILQLPIGKIAPPKYKFIYLFILYFSDKPSFERILSLLVPSEKVSSICVRKIFAWIMTNAPNIEKVQCILQWLLVQLKATRLDPSQLQYLHSYIAGDLLKDYKVR